MLGTDLVRVLRERGRRVVALTSKELDVTDAAACEAAILGARPSVVFNCAAYTNVNGAEAEYDLAMLVNGTGAGNVARACRAAGARLIHVSTDYVFDGENESPYCEDDKTNPINAYGRSKLAGEENVRAELDDHIIARTSWLFGKNGQNFVTTMLSAARAGKPLKVVSDQKGAPTYTFDLAGALVFLADSTFRGTVHVTGSGACSWYEFAQKIFELNGVEPVELTPITTDEFPTPARRPKNSCLSNQRLLELGMSPLPEWQDGLARYLSEMNELRK